MTEVCVIEECITTGIWILFSENFYTDKAEAARVCSDATEKMKKLRNGFTARVTKLRKV